MNEYVGILLFFCAPALALLVAFIVVTVRGHRRFARFPSFSVEIVSLGREDPTMLVYKARGRRIELPAEVRPGLFRRRIYVAIPPSVDKQEIPRILQDLDSGLRHLRCEYLIYDVEGVGGRREILAQS
jgi:hypothetical protein